MIKKSMKTLATGLLLSGMVVTSISAIQAQVEVLEPDQITSFQKQLPQLSQSAKQVNLKTYLQRVSPSTFTAREITNAVRVANDVSKSTLDANAFFAHYSVPALSSVMRLPDSYPQDGEIGEELGIVLAGDQYEDGSFEIYPFKDFDQVQLKVEPLKSSDGSTFPAENLDLKVVKVWYQNGNAFLSYFTDPGLKLVPELLLHDENLIRVDTRNKANYARIKTDKGSREVWISAPQKIDIGFDPYQDGFADAKTLQPVKFKAGEFKQFVLTAHAAKNTKPGLYRGSITVTADGEKPYSIPVAIKVLSFQLPLPKTNYDINKDFVVSLYSVWPTIDTSNKAFLPTLKNMRAHNLLQVGPNVGYETPVADAEKQVKLMKEAGFLSSPIMDAGNYPWVTHDFDGLMQIRRISRKQRAFYSKHFGDSDVLVRQGDERGASWLVDERMIWREAHQQGIISGLATNTKNSFPTSAYTMDWRPLATTPGDEDTANKWAQIGSGYTGFYANQHNGSENPAFVRRQHGLLGYLSNFDMVDNYQFAYGPWNDRAWPVYKPMVLAYPISDGLVDTLEWEGFRAAIDDIRYATKLRQLSNAAIDSGNQDRVEAGRKVRQWFAMMDGNSIDLNQTRIEMIEKIEELIQLEKA